MALPPLMGYIKDTTNTYDYALLLVAAALVSGGALGLYLRLATARARQTATSPDEVFPANSASLTDATVPRPRQDRCGP